MSEQNPQLDVASNGRAGDTGGGHASVRKAVGYLLSSAPSAPGFRFSRTDGAAIVITALATLLLWRPLQELALLFPIVLGHFFLFCNVFRVCRASELTWAGLFVVNFVAWSLSGHFSWWHVLLVQTPITVLFLVLEILSPRYHGVRFAACPSASQTQGGDTTSFAACVRSPEPVRTAFAEVPLIRTWWRIVLALHGKPIAADMPVDEVRSIVAAGFVFYGRLYAMLGFLFLILSIGSFRIAMEAQGTYWLLLGFAAGGYLLLAATVAKKGATVFLRSSAQGTSCLVLFLVMVIVFLAMFLAAASIAAAYLLKVPNGLNVLMLAGIAAFGIGSYLLELLFLVHVASGGTRTS